MSFGTFVHSALSWPGKKSKIIYAIKVASWENWRDTISWLGYNVLGSFMPIWGSYFLLRSKGQSFAVHDFMQHGEFAIYSAAFLAPALQLIVRNLGDKRYALRTGSVLIAVFGLMLCAFLYAGVPQPEIAVGPSETVSTPQGFFINSSWYIFVSTLLFVSVVTLIQHQRENPNVTDIEGSQVAELRDKFEKKLEGGNDGQ